MKKILISLMLACATLVFAQDNVGPQSGVVRNLATSRWSTSLVGNYSATFGTVTAVTNVVSSTPALIGKLVVYPGTIGDNLVVYNANAASGIAASKEVFKWTAASATFSSGNSITLGLPVIFDLMPGMFCSSGIVTISGQTSASTTTRNYLMYDGVE